MDNDAFIIYLIKFLCKKCNPDLIFYLFQPYSFERILNVLTI